MIIKIMDMCYDWMDPIELVMDGFMGPNWYTDDATHFIEMDKESMEVKDVGDSD